MASLKSNIQYYFDRLPKPLRNKFIVVIAVFVIWMGLFDKHSLYKQFKLQSTLKALQTKRSYFKDEINKDTKKGLELTTDDKSLEKFAREEHLMKRDDEDIFVIVEKEE
jgi:cell division protein FtsB